MSPPHPHHHQRPYKDMPDRSGPLVAEFFKGRKQQSALAFNSLHRLFTQYFPQGKKLYHLTKALAFLIFHLSHPELRPLADSKATTTSTSPISAEMGVAKGGR
jgi:hypothetical protein